MVGRHAYAENRHYRLYARKRAAFVRNEINSVINALVLLYIYYPNPTPIFSQHFGRGV